MISLKRVLISLSALLCIAASLQAQLNRGSITGTVTDPTGAVIPKVNILILNTATGATYETAANENGQYTVPNLPIGDYQITFEVASFKKLVRSGINLGVTEVLRVDAALALGSMDDTIEVTAEVPRLQTDTPEMSTTMSNRQMVDVPFSFANGRLMENFTYRTHPGVFGNRWENNINGAPFFSRDTLLDGASTTTQVQGGMVLTSVSMEAVQELKVQTSGISAEFGRTRTNPL
ncbi:MAG: carboxypeptidase-like regulatory domain-containing protein, partial [Acidobacteria bacterium]|nr:carboxypeptidase-like regulatory domain-containing protein [Acidobacteriota bacterium]